MYKDTYKGKYRVKNPKKYKGDINEVVYRSGWELKFFNWCDNNPSVIEWGSEIAVIPYLSPLDKKIHRYFIDVYVKIVDAEGKVNKYLIEIKPKKFTQPPKGTKKKTKNFIREALQYEVNSAKWAAAESFCKKNDLKFIILTEDSLGIKHGNN